MERRNPVKTGGTTYNKKRNNKETRRWLEIKIIRRPSHWDLYVIYFVDLRNSSTRCGRKVMRQIFYLPVFIIYIIVLLYYLVILFIIYFIMFFKHQCYPLQNSSLGQLHTDLDVIPTSSSIAGSLQPVWYSECPLHSFESSLKPRNDVLWGHF